MPPKCAIRNTPNAEICSLCHSRAYCSVEWQQTDWPLHKLLCKANNDLPAGPKPFLQTRHLISRLVDSKAPQLVWIECQRRETDVAPYGGQKIRRKPKSLKAARWGRIQKVLSHMEKRASRLRPGTYGHCLVQGYVFGGWVEHKRNCRRKHARQARLRVGKTPYNINLLGRRWKKKGGNGRPESSQDRTNQRSWQMKMWISPSVKFNLNALPIVGRRLLTLLCRYIVLNTQKLLSISLILIPGR